jgi:hypothetical protein
MFVRSKSVYVRFQDQRYHPGSVLDELRMLLHGLASAGVKTVEKDDLMLRLLHDLKYSGNASLVKPYQLASLMQTMEKEGYVEPWIEGYHLFDPGPQIHGWRILSKGATA